jgi:hypothetical protein
MRRALAAALLGLGLAACGEALPPASFAGGEPVFAPERFFAGETRSTGMLETAAGAPAARLHVEGHGRALSDGRLELVQDISLEGETPRTRTWELTRMDAHHFSATLTDASGPVRAEAYGPLFHLTYPLKGVPLGSMEQWLYLQPDGCTVVNEGVVRIAGLTVRRLSERISQAPAPGGGC